MRYWKLYILSALLLGLPGFSSGVLAQDEDELEDLIGSVVEEEDELERVETQIPGLEEEEALLGRAHRVRGARTPRPRARARTRARPASRRLPVTPNSIITGRSPRRRQPR